MPRIVNFFTILLQCHSNRLLDIFYNLTYSFFLLYQTSQLSLFPHISFPSQSLWIALNSHSLSLCRWLGLHGGGLASSMVVFWFFFVCLFVCLFFILFFFCDRRVLWLFCRYGWSGLWVTTLWVVSCSDCGLLRLVMGSEEISVGEVMALDFGFCMVALVLPGSAFFFFLCCGVGGFFFFGNMALFRWDFGE